MGQGGMMGWMGEGWDGVGDEGGMEGWMREGCMREDGWMREGREG